jgi:transcriptional regulator with XRE-family HTH domain
MLLPMSKIDFIEWLQKIMQDRRMSKADLARESGISPAQITRITTGEQGLSIDSAVAIASALKVEPDEVFKKAAGLMSNPTGPLTREAEFLLSLLPPDKQQQAIDYIRFLASQQEAANNVARGMGKAQPNET